MKKKIFIFISILVCLSVAVGIYLYKKPRSTAASQPTDFILSADELYKQFETNEQGANLKYTGKILEVTGTISEVQKSDSMFSILLTAKGAMGGINCSMATNDANTIIQGKKITVKGKCAGFLMDVNVLDGVLISGK